MKKLHREVVILPEAEHRKLRKIAKQSKLPKSRVFRLALAQFTPTPKHL